MKHVFMVGIIFCLVLITGCSTTGETSSIEIQDPWTRSVKSMAGHSDDDQSDMENSGMAKQNGAVYMVIRNNAGDADKLINATSDVADAVEIHLSSMEDGVMKMEQIDYVDIPASGEAVLEPGSYHIMLIGLKQDLVTGEGVDFVLDFENAGQLSITAEIRNP